MTKREREVFELLVQDSTTKEIATELFISEKTVRNHISNVIQNIGVKRRALAVVRLLRVGELTLSTRIRLFFKEVGFLSIGYIIYLHIFRRPSNRKRQQMLTYYGKISQLGDIQE